MNRLLAESMAICSATLSPRGPPPPPARVHFEGVGRRTRPCDQREAGHGVHAEENAGSSPVAPVPGCSSAGPQGWICWMVFERRLVTHTDWLMTAMPVGS